LSEHVKRVFVGFIGSQEPWDTNAPQVALTGRIENVLDRQYQTAYGYNQSGRAVYVGAIWSPK